MKSAIAQYYPGDSALHRLDPRAKIVAVTAVAIALFTRESFLALAVYGAAVLAALLLSRVPLAWYWRGLRPILWLIALTFVAQLLFVRGPALVSLGPLRLTTHGLETAAFLSLRLVVLVVAGSLLTLTTTPIALTDGLAWLARPLRRLRVPTEELALMMTIALRFIPTLLVEVETIMRALVPLLVPLFVVSFRRADELALAMEARCYRPGIVRTRLHPLRAGPDDWVLIAIVAGLIVLASLL